MEVINNLFAGSQHRSRNEPSAISSSSNSIRCKWPHRRWRTKPQKKETEITAAATAAEVCSEPGSAVESYPGLVRIPADDSCVVCANDVDYLYVLHKCGHRACLDCWRTFASSQVSSFAMAHITCIACDRRLSRVLTIQLLKPRHGLADPFSANGTCSSVSAEQQTSAEKLSQRYEDFLLYQCLLHDKHTRWCPRGCGYAVLAGRGFHACPRLECKHSDCQGESFCYKCRGPWGNDGHDHVCRHLTASATKASRGGAGGGTEEDILAENHRSLFSRLQGILRLPTDAATAAAAVIGETETHGILEGGSEGLARRPVERRFSTPAMPVQAAVDIATSTEDEEEDNVMANRASDGDISQVELDLPDNLNGQVKSCPRCKTLLLKLDDGSCNHMSCFICGCEFCWLCLREVRDTHFLSPTGCTFWGRKRWPFRRRICAMLLAAFGTPFILAILTALVLPGIAIGFPAYLVHKVGKQVKGSKRKRILLKTLSFFGGLLASPIISALVALFGIPLVLIYVYIFMPITLFSELKVRLNSESGNTPAVDPEVGFKIDWNRVGESGSASSTTTIPPETQKDSAETLRPSKPKGVGSVSSLEVLHEKAAESTF